MKLNFILILIVLSGVSLVTSQYNKRIEISEEQRLYRNLLRDYEKSVRPTYNATQTITVALGITLVQIADLDERNQVLTTIVWLDQEWNDQKMRWEPSEYGGLKKIRLPCNLLWLPDIVLYNSVDDHLRGYMQSLAMIESHGVIFWPPVVKMRSSCKIDIKWFPFDSQICVLKLGSWAYDGDQVDVTNRSTEVDTSNFVTNGEWDIVSTRVIRNVKYYPCCKEPFPDMTFYLHLQRRHLYYVMNIILPCMMMSLLTMTTFALPADSGEKISLGLTVMLSFSVFMSLVAETMPPTSESAPLASVYLTIIMGLSAVSVIMSIIVLNVHMRGNDSRAPPKIVRNIFKILAKILLHEFNLADFVDDDESSSNSNGVHEVELRCFTHRSAHSQVPVDKFINFNAVPQRGTFEPLGEEQLRHLSCRFKLENSRHFSHIASTNDDCTCSCTCDTLGQSSISSFPKITLTQSHEVRIKTPFANCSVGQNNCPSTSGSSGKFSKNIPHLFAKRRVKSIESNAKFTMDSPLFLQTRYNNNNSTYSMNSSNDHTFLDQSRTGLSLTLKEFPSEEQQESSSMKFKKSGSVFENINDPNYLIERINKNQRFLARRERSVKQWQSISSILDRLLLAIFILATSLVSVTMLIVIPQTRNVFTENILAETIDNDKLILERNNKLALEAYESLINNSLIAS